MTNASERDPAVFYEDTVELELTPEDVLALSRAAEEDHAGASAVESTPGSSLPTFPFAKEPSQGDGAAGLGGWPRTLAVGVIAAIIAMGGSANRPAARHSPVSSAPTTPSPADSQAAPVQFTNPFDASEVFEFPPGTTETAAREAVAELLLQRARDRRPEWGRTKHRFGNRVASSRSHEDTG